MADLRRIDGTPLDIEKNIRNERIAAILERLTEENNSGRLTAFVSVTMTPEAMHEVCWSLPDQDFGFPWGLALRGALMAAMHRIAAAEVVVVDRSHDPDGA